MPTSEIFILESQFIIAADLAVHLSELGYKNSRIYNSHKQMSQALAKELPLLIIINIAVFNNNDGVHIAQKLKAHFQVPIVFMSSGSDLNSIRLALTIEPYAFISIPFDHHEIKSAIGISKHRIQMSAQQQWKSQHRMKVIVSNPQFAN